MTRRRSVALPVAALLVAAAAWGSTVVVAKSAFAEISPTNLLVSRLALSGLVLLVVFWRRLRMPRATAIRGGGLGVLFALGLGLQTYGLEHTTPSFIGFVTATYVVFTALITAVLLRQRQPRAIWLATALTVVGIVVLALGAGGQTTSLGLGAGLAVLGAVVFAFHIVLLGRWVRPDNVAQLTLAQSLAGLAAALAVAPFSGFALPSGPGLAWQLLYLGIFCGAVTLFLQSWAQSHVPATPSAIIMCSEPVWAAVFAIGFGLEPLTGFVVAGGLLVVGALLLTSAPRAVGSRLDRLVAELRRRPRSDEA